MNLEDVTTPRRRSSRLSAPEEKPIDKPVVAPAVTQRKTFALKKIVARKTQVAELNKENDERLSNILEKRPKMSTPASEKKSKVSTPSSEKKQNMSTPSSEKRPKMSTPAPEKKSKVSTPSSEEERPKVSTRSSEKKPKVSTSAPVDAPPPRPSPSPTVLSPIVAPQSPPRSAVDQSRDDEVWSQKVRRSYSRLSGDASFVSPVQQQGSSSPVAGRRETLFGFEKMPTPKVIRSMSATMSVPAPQASSSMCGVSSLNLSEAEESLNRSGEPDPNIPGVAIQKKHARKKKVQPITMSELDVLAAKMNAEFAEAEDFELVVE